MVLHSFFTVMGMSRPAYICLKEKSSFPKTFLKQGSLGSCDRAINDNTWHSPSLWRLVPGQVLGGRKACGIFWHSCAFESYQKCAPLKFKMYYSHSTCSSTPSGLAKHKSIWMSNLTYSSQEFLPLAFSFVHSAERTYQEFLVTGLSWFN